MWNLDRARFFLSSTTKRSLLFSLFYGFFHPPPYLCAHGGIAHFLAFFHPKKHIVACMGTRNTRRHVEFFFLTLTDPSAKKKKYRDREWCFYLSCVPTVSVLFYAVFWKLKSEISSPWRVEVHGEPITSVYVFFFVVCCSRDLGLCPYLICAFIRSRTSLIRFSRCARNSS